MSVITQLSLEDQMRVNPSLDRRAVAQLEEWNLQQNLVPKLTVPDLALFLFNHFYDVEATKQNIINYFFMRHRMPEYFVSSKDLHSPELHAIFESVFIVTLPQRTSDNYKVILARLIDHDPAKYNFQNAIKVLNMVLDAGVYEDGPDNKYIFIFDLNGVTMEHARTIDLIGLSNFYEYMRKGSSAKWIGAHYVNTGTVNIDLQEFVKSNIVDGDFTSSSMLQFYPDVDTMIKTLSMEHYILPNEMGGGAGPAAEMQKKQVKKLKSLDAFFVNLDSKMKLVNTDTIPSALEIFDPKNTL